MRFKLIVPLHDLRLTSNVTPFHFSPGVTLDVIPDWIRKDRFVLKDLSQADQDDFARCTHCLTQEYEVEEWATHDLPEGAKPRSVHTAKKDLSYLANLALWLQRPTAVGFTLMFRASERSGNFIEWMQRHDRFLCLPGESQSITLEDLGPAQRLYTSLAQIPRRSAPWTACRAVTAALQMDHGEIRDLLLWIALEALFGAESEITYRLSQRLALFVARDRAEARELFGKTKQGYKIRCELAHGKWGQESDDFMAHIVSTEGLVRRSLVRVLQDDDTIKIFCGKNHQAYLNDLPFAESNAHPSILPLPEQPKEQTRRDPE